MSLTGWMVLALACSMALVLPVAADQKIAFTAPTNDGGTDIFVSNPDGSNVIRLTQWRGYDESPAWSPDGEHIAFSSNRDGGNYDIYMMDVDGGNVKQLTSGIAYDTEPAWSPDGTRIAFTSDTDVFVMDSDGNNPARLAWGEHPTWSPDGRIAFESQLTGDWEIFVMDANGGNQIQLTDQMDAHQPAWSPDGEMIAFYSQRDGRMEIYVMDANGGHPTRLTHSESGLWCYQPAWSLDSSKIVFASDMDSPTGYYQIYVMDANGGNLEQVTFDLNTRWSDKPTYGHIPTAGRIAFASNRDGNWEIYVIDTDGIYPRRLTVTPLDNEFEPAWSPDGRMIAYSSDRDGNQEIYTMNTADGMVEKLTNTDGPVINEDPAWSPDGKLIAFASDRFLSKEIFVMDAGNGGRLQQLTDDEYDDSHPAWSPDWSLAPGLSTQISFESDRPHPGCGDACPRTMDIWAMNEYGLDRTLLTWFTQENKEPAWSPDGGKIAYASGDENEQIYVMDSSGENVIQWTNVQGAARDPAWSPDSREGNYQIAFTTIPSDTYDEEIFAVESPMGDLTRLTKNHWSDIQPAWWGPELWQTKIIWDYRDLQLSMQGMGSGVFLNPNMQSTLINKVGEASALTSQGNYRPAINKLENDIQKKTDGCAVSGAPDKNDWIIDCTAQGAIYPTITSVIGDLKEL